MWKKILEGTKDIIWPKRCFSCGRHLSDTQAVDTLICKNCWQEIKKNTPPFCRVCGRHLSQGHGRTICVACLKQKKHFDCAFSPCVYEGVLKELIHQFKYKGLDYLGKTLARLMIDFIKEYRLPIQYTDLLVPIPLSPERQREREFNQARVLAGCIAEEFRKDMADGLLRKTRATKSQAELAPQQRFDNIKGCFEVINPQAVKNKHIMLIDDVLTTAATSSEAALALKQAGAGMVFVMTLAN